MLSMAFMQMGQFVDHDVILTPTEEGDILLVLFTDYQRIMVTVELHSKHSNTKIVLS